MPTPEDLLREAEQLEAEGRAAMDAGRVEDAAVAFAQALVRRRVAQAMARTTLPSPQQSGTSTEMLSTARVRTSAGKGPKRGKLIVVANAAGFTMRSLAERLKIEGFRTSHASLSRAQHGIDRVPEALAKRVQVLTKSVQYPNGFEATLKNWPKGWV